MPARLMIILLFFLFILSFEKCQVCVHYLKITAFTPAINIGVLASIIVHIHIHTRLLIKCLSLKKNICNDTLNASGNATMIAPCAYG
jgi:uncharacterized integral membrane protein